MDWTGYVCISRSSEADASLLLGQEDWAEHFDVLAVDSETWETLDRAGFWAVLNEACEVLIDQYEEEWVAPEHAGQVLAAVETYLPRFDIQTPVARFLAGLRALAQVARRRSVPLIFSM